MSLSDIVLVYERGTTIMRVSGCSRSVRSTSLFHGCVTLRFSVRMLLEEFALLGDVRSHCIYI